MGFEALRSISELNEVDLAIITTPATMVLDALDACSKGNVKTAFILSSGFGELGEAGKVAEKELVRIARKTGLRFVGPNSVGILCSSSNLHAMMPEMEIKPGKISLISQSGNIGSQMLYRGGELGLGFNIFVSTGNEADLHCEDYIDYLRQEPYTRVIIVYIEGLRCGRKFLESAKRTTAEKPIILFKGGRTKTGADAVESHTGALAGSTMIYDAALKQSGIIKAEAMQDLLDLALAFNSNLYPKNRKVAILSRGGGWAVIAADAVEEVGLELPELTGDMIRELDDILPSYWNRKNPIDTVMASGFTLMKRVLDLLGRWEDIGGIIMLGGFGAYFARIWNEEETEKVSRKMVELSRSKVVFAVPFTLNDDSRAIKLLRENNIPLFPDAKRAITAYSKLVGYHEYLSK